MTETTIRPNRFRTNKPQQEEVITEVEVVEEDEIINDVSTTDNIIKRTRNIKKEEVVKVEEIEPEVKSVVKPASSIPRKFNFSFVKPKVERIVEPVVEVNEITGKNYLEVLANEYAEYLESCTEKAENDLLIKEVLDSSLSLLFIKTLEDCFKTKIFPKYDKVDFFGSTFEKHVTTPNFRKSPSTKTNKDRQVSFIYTEGDIKVTYLNKLDSDSLRAYFYLDEDGNIDRIESVNKKKEVTAVTDGSLDYLIPSLEKYIESLGV
jgi:hypothetical protein